MKAVFNEQVRIVNKQKCFECGIRHGAKAIRTHGGRYIELDDFEFNTMVKLSEKTVKVYLKVLPLDYANTEFLLKNYAPFCPHHAQIHMSEQIRKIRKLGLKQNNGLSVSKILELKNWFHNSFGIRPTTKDVVFLYRHFEKMIINETEL